MAAAFFSSGHPVRLCMRRSLRSALSTLRAGFRVSCFPVRWAVAHQRGLTA